MVKFFRVVTNLKLNAETNSDNIFTQIFAEPKCKLNISFHELLAYV